MTTPHLLFHNGDLEATLTSQVDRMRRKVAQLSADRVLGTPVEDLVDGLVDEFCANPIVLHRDRMTSSGAMDATIEMQEFQEVYRIPGTRVEWLVPFEGDVVLFQCKPSTFTFSPPRVEIRGMTLVAAYEGRSPIDPTTVRGALERDIADVEKWLGWQRESIDPFNERLPQQARSAVNARRAKVLADRDLDAALEVPLVQSAPASSVITAPRRRRRPASGSPAVAPFVPEPAISEDSFREITEALRVVTRFMERLPETSGGMGEESLRDLILISLNNQFGDASGETFSRRGKTDLYLPHDDPPGAVFIAECKIWKGPAGVGKAVDQLLGYLTWRDTHAALILFLRSGSPEAVHSKAVAAIRGHPAFKRDRASEADVFTLASEADPLREVHMALLVVPLLP